MRHERHVVRCVHHLTKTRLRPPLTAARRARCSRYTRRFRQLLLRASKLLQSAARASRQRCKCLPAATNAGVGTAVSPVKSIRNPSYSVTLAQSPTYAALGHVRPSAACPNT